MKKIHAYVCDFPAQELAELPQVIALPHLGASTREAERNCAIMAASQLISYLSEGSVTNSVNFPLVAPPPLTDYRLAIVHDNKPGVLAEISNLVAKPGNNIVDLTNRSRDKLAYTLLDLESEPSPDDLLNLVSVRRVRYFEAVQ